jgi:hypothetical protein
MVCSVVAPHCGRFASLRAAQRHGLVARADSYSARRDIQLDSDGVPVKRVYRSGHACTTDVGATNERQLPKLKLCTLCLASFLSDGGEEVKIEANKCGGILVVPFFACASFQRKRSVVVYCSLLVIKTKTVGPVMSVITFERKQEDTDALNVQSSVRRCRPRSAGSHCTLPEAHMHGVTDTRVRPILDTIRRTQPRDHEVRCTCLPFCALFPSHPGTQQ